MAKKVAICTLGCKVNTYESEAVRQQFEKQGYISVDFSEFADVYIINTCTVTHLGDRKSRQMTRRTKQINPDSVLVVMGCYSQIAPGEVSRIEEVDIILGTAKKACVYDAVAAFLEERERKNLVCDISQKTEFEELEVTSYEGRTRAILKIQDGCNNFCSYCIIPYARGRICSRSIESSVIEAKRLVSHGFCEIVLVGIHIASFGRDTGESLLDLLRRLNDIDGLERIRMGSLEPTLFDEKFTNELAKLPKICRHFHLSLQSGCDETLKRMNRKYLTSDYLASVERIRTAFADAAITTDIMVGFPGESEVEFEKTSEFVKKVAFADAHIFKYSIRKGTAAEKMKNQIDAQTKEERSKVLASITEKSREEFVYSFVGKTMKVLFEREYKGKSGSYEGKTDNYITVVAKSDKDISGKILNVEIESVIDSVVYGRIVD